MKAIAALYRMDSILSEKLILLAWFQIISLWSKLGRISNLWIIVNEERGNDWLSFL